MHDAFAHDLEIQRAVLNDLSQYVPSTPPEMGASSFFLCGLALLRVFPLLVFEKFGV